jgi:hypothetical protein
MAHCIVCDDGRVAPMRRDGERVGSVDSSSNINMAALNGGNTSLCGRWVRSARGCIYHCSAELRVCAYVAPAPTQATSCHIVSHVYTACIKQQRSKRETRGHDRETIYLHSRGAPFKLGSAAWPFWPDVAVSVLPQQQQQP